MNTQFDSRLHEAPRLVLAPMQGLVDAPVRDVLTRLGGIDYCVSEFLRVNDRLLPDCLFFRVCPELQQGGHTPGGVPVQLQILGSHPRAMAENALRGIELGAPGIDINFGCPAKVVNRRKGGAVLLQEPDTVHAVVKAVRDALPASVVVSAKMRLGYTDCTLMHDNVRAIAEAGASWITVHGRTKVQGYTPPAYWDQIGELQSAVKVPVIANGEIWTLADAQQCRAESGCHSLMLGRGLLADPFLAQRIVRHTITDADPLTVLLDYIAILRQQCHETRTLGRLKQWLSLMASRDAAMRELFLAVRSERRLDPAMQRVRDAMLPAAVEAVA